MLDSLLEKDPTKRPTVKELITDYPFVRKAVIDLYFDISKEPSLANPIIDQLGKTYFTSSLETRIILPEVKLPPADVKPHPKLKGSFPDGSRYEGEVQDGLRHGKGICRYRPLDRFREYDGFWVNDLFEGEGTLTFRDGTQYCGHFHRGKQNGTGK